MIRKALMGGAIAIASWGVAAPVAHAQSCAPPCASATTVVTAAPGPDIRPVTAGATTAGNPIAAGPQTVTVSGLPPGVEPVPQGVLRRSSTFGSAWIAAAVGLGGLFAALGATVRRRLAWIKDRPEATRDASPHEAAVEAGAAWETVAGPDQVPTSRTSP